MTILTITDPELAGSMTHPPEKALEAVRTLLRTVGQDPGRDGLTETPARVLRALMEMTAGEREDPAVHLGRQFQQDGMDTDEMIVLRHIPFTSLCEHHLLPFYGTATVAYIPAPDSRIVGLSKLARVVEGYARRLQVQERMTGQIARCIGDNLATRGAGVVVSATHSCMAIRGIRKTDAQMVTSKLTGLFRTDPRTRQEFFDIAREGSHGR